MGSVAEPVLEPVPGGLVADGVGVGVGEVSGGGDIGSAMIGGLSIDCDIGPDPAFLVPAAPWTTPFPCPFAP
jgi:hypothetical protein